MYFFFSWHLTSTGNVICMLDGVLRTPLFQCLSIINETDLHGNWLPFISVTKNNG
jgi:predicted methyltransferase MtxX (methanogen marker protein 4)